MRKLVINISLFLIFITSVNLAGKESGFLYIDKMDTMSGWQFSMDKYVEARMITADGKKGKCVGIKYNLKNGTWVQISKNLNLDLSDMKYIQFDFKGIGAINNLEVKLVDKDGSNFGKKFENFTRTEKWIKVRINKKEFTYLWGGDNKMDWKNIKSIWLAVSAASGEEGEVFFDNIEYKPEENILDLRANKLKVVIDDFERSDPYKVYLPVLNDNSSLDLRASREYVIGGNYSMELYYKLSTVKSEPSSISALYSGINTFDWRNVSYVQLWIKGDSSGNIFTIGIIDGSGELWEYNNYNVLNDNKWHLIKVAINKFKLSSKKAINNKVFDLNGIEGFQFGVKGITTDDSQGRIYIDSFGVTGKNLNVKFLVPPAMREKITLERPQGNVDIRGMGSLDYSWIPELGYNLYGYVKLKFDAEVRKFGVYLEIATEPVEFGHSSFIEENNNVTYLKMSKTSLQFPCLRLSVKDPFPYVNNIIAGNLFENFSDDTYSISHTDFGEWGYMGIKVTGGFDNLYYRNVIIKGMFDSYVYTGEISTTVFNTYIKGIYVYDYKRAHIPNTGVFDPTGTVIDYSQSSDLKTEDVSRDVTFNIEIKRELYVKQYQYFNRSIIGRIIYGENYYKQYADAELKYENYEVEDYIYNYKYSTPIHKYGKMIKGEFIFDSFPWNNLYAVLRLRYYDKDYKPMYRKIPYDYDELYAGTTGIHFRFYQGRLYGFSLSGESDYLIRNDTSKYYYRKFFRYGFDTPYLWLLRISLYNELKFQNDRYYMSKLDNLTTKEENIISYIFQITMNFSPYLKVFEEQRYETIIHPAEDKEYHSLRFYILLQYYMSKNALFKAEGVFFKYGSQYWEAHTEPYNDNYWKIYFEINF